MRRNLLLSVPPRLRGCLGLLALLACAPSLAAGETRAGVWISAEEIARLPDNGPAWNEMVTWAQKKLPPADIAPRDSFCDVQVMARALVHVRTGNARCRDEAISAIRAVMGTEKAADVLSLGRNLPGYVIAADLLELPSDLERQFREWLEGLLDEELDGTTLRQVHERRPNNWGTHAGGARAVIARYLDDERELERVARVFRGWVGEREAYDGFEFGDRDWQADARNPVAVNPRGATKEGHSIDGVLPDDQRRAGGFAWPPPKENYVYEALQGALLQAVVLSRAGFDAWEWGDRALLRAAVWLDRVADYPASGDDTWQPYVIKHFYGVELRTVSPSRPGKNVGWTDWTLAATRAQ